MVTFSCKQTHPLISSLVETDSITLPKYAGTPREFKIMFFKKKIKKVGSKFQLFIIDDEEDIRENLIEQLSDRFECDFHEFENCEAALKNLDSAKIAPDLILSDVKMKE